MWRIALGWMAGKFYDRWKAEMSKIRDDEKSKIRTLYLKGYSIRNIAKALSRSESTIRAYIARAIKDGGKFADAVKRKKSPRAGAHTHVGAGTPARTHTRATIETTLTPKQERFVQGLIAGKSQRQAFTDAGYSTSRFKPETIDVKASELARNGKVLVRYHELNEEAAKAAVLTRADVIRELQRIGFADMSDYVQTDGKRITITPTSELSKEQRAAIALIDKTADGIKVSLHNKVRALERLLDELPDVDMDDTMTDGFIEALRGDVSTVWQEQ